MTAELTIAVGVVLTAVLYFPLKLVALLHVLLSQK